MIPVLPYATELLLIYMLQVLETLALPVAPTPRKSINGGDVVVISKELASVFSATDSDDDDGSLTVA